MEGSLYNSNEEMNLSSIDGTVAWNPALRPDSENPVPGDAPPPFNHHIKEISHAPSQSFARTVSHDMTWADDEELDSIWDSAQKGPQPSEYAPRSPQANDGVGTGVALFSNTAVPEPTAPSGVVNGSSTATKANNHVRLSHHEEDLAAKWAAVLEDEEFLDEDEEIAQGADEKPLSLVQEGGAGQANPLGFGEAVGQTSELDPAIFFGEDEEGFLEDGDIPGSAHDIQNHQLHSNADSMLDAQGQTKQSSDSIRDERTDLIRPGIASGTYSTTSARPVESLGNPYLPSNAQPSSASSNTQYSPQQPVQNMSTANAYFHPVNSNTSIYGYSQPTASQPSRPEISKAQSFADKSKGGYASPYDLPMDVTRPRKRQSVQQLVGTHRNHVAQRQGPLPPRSASMSTDQNPLSGPPAPQVLSRGPTSNILPADALNSNAQLPMAAISISSTKTLKSKPSFFEDLPVTVKPKHSAAHGRTASPQAFPTAPTSRPPFDYPAPNHIEAPTAHSQSSSLEDVTLQLQAPPRVSPYSVPPPLNSSAVPGTTTASRYSPAPNPLSGTSISQQRYATPPSSAPPATKLPHQPRTSSPLAHSNKASSIQGQSEREKRPEEFEYPKHESVRSEDDSQEGYQNSRAIEAHRLVQSEDSLNQRNTDQSSQPQASRDFHAPTNRYSPIPGGAAPVALPFQSMSSLAQAPPRRSSQYAPSPLHTQSSSDEGFIPPRRSQTQSPSALKKSGPIMTIQEQSQRPASAHHPTSPRLSIHSQSIAMNEGPTGARARAFSQSLEYVVPNDERQSDALQRWRGCPIFIWGFGGTVVTSFPQEIPMYSGGQTVPKLRCVLGEVKIKKSQTIIPLEDHITKFPGPLRGKGKKKELITWLNGRIEMLEREIPAFKTSASSPDSLGEKILLWKVICLMVENDGVLEGSPKVDSAVRKLLSPDLETESQSIDPIATSLSQSLDELRLQREPVSIDVTQQLRHLLLRGEREKAVWYAADQRLWAHAMLISSTLSQDTWKRVCSEFVQKEIQMPASNAESFAALYEVFAGNSEESIDKLVHPTARLGQQLLTMPPALGVQPKNPLDGLNKWRESLGLILSNRTADDSKAIHALGKLLAEFGRVEAAHVCFIFGRGNSQFGAAGDPQTDFILVGSDETSLSSTLARDIEPIILSEVYEFALSLSGVPNASKVPHLQIYKLHHALTLAENGFRSEAQQYCAAISSTARSFPYQDGLFLSGLDDLTVRLQNSAKDGSSSWVSKPSMEKVSGAFSAKFYSFIAGDESDAASTGSGREADVGPFAKIAGSTPEISRNPSNSDLYGTYVSSGGSKYNTGRQSPSKAQPSSRYAPSSVPVPFQQNPPTSESQNHFPADLHDPPMGLGLDTSQPYNPLQVQAVGSYTVPDYSTNSFQPQQGMPQEPNPYTPITSTSRPTSSPSNSYQPVQAVEFASRFGPSQSYSPTKDHEPLQRSAGYKPQAHANDLDQISKFEAVSSYGAPSYEPYNSEQQHGGYSPPTDNIQAFKDDDREEASSDAVNEKTKAEKDREAEENFKRAAEADGMYSTLIA